MIRVDVLGDLLDGLAEELEEDLLPRLLTAADAGADLLLEEVQRRLSRVGPPEPGAAPAKRRGELQASFRRVPAKRRGPAVVAGIQSDELEAGRLEFGGKDARGIMLPAHPYLRPAEDAISDRVAELVDRE